MVKNVKLGTKIIGGFGIVLIALIIPLDEEDFRNF